MSLLDEEDYGRQPRVLKVRVCFVCFPPIYVLPFSSPYLPPPLLRFYAISNIFGVSTSQAGNRWEALAAVGGAQTLAVWVDGVVLRRQQLDGVQMPLVGGIRMEALQLAGW